MPRIHHRLGSSESTQWLWRQVFCAWEVDVRGWTWAKPVLQLQAQDNKLVAGSFPDKDNLGSPPCLPSESTHCFPAIVWQVCHLLAKSGNKIPGILFIKDNQTPVIVRYCIIMKNEGDRIHWPQRKQNKVSLWSNLLAHVWFRRLTAMLWESLIMLSYQRKEMAFSNYHYTMYFTERQDYYV